MNCPQCHINRYQLKNSKGERIVVTVNDKLEIIPIHPDESLEGFDTETLYCLGCSWSGSVRMLTKKH